MAKKKSHFSDNQNILEAQPLPPMMFIKHINGATFQRPKDGKAASDQQLLDAITFYSLAKGGMPREEDALKIPPAARRRLLGWLQTGRSMSFEEEPLSRHIVRFVHIVLDAMECVGIGKTTTQSIIWECLVATHPGQEPNTVSKRVALALEYALAAHWLDHVEDHFMILRITAAGKRLEERIRLSASCRPGQLRSILEALEAGEDLHARGFSERFGHPLSWFKDAVKESKYDQKDEILKLLNTIT